MRGISTIADLASNIISAPRPILCLDTCDFLDVVRRFVDPNSKEANLHNARSFREALDELIIRPDRFQIVITYLVRHEWRQNIDEELKKVARSLEETETRIDLIAEACGLSGTTVPSLSPRMTGLPVATSLVALAEEVLDRATVIEEDHACIDRALGRVMGRRRPSHKNQIKDSIHWEHYLELSRQLGVSGHGLDRLFVSANKADFWTNRDTPTIHPDLEAEANAAGLQFFGRLDEALRSLGI